MRLIIPGVLLFLVFAVSCSKNNCTCSEGVIKDRTGLDGCGLLIELDNGKTLEPAELAAGITLTKDKRVCVTYAELKDRASACMAGEIVKITSIRYLP